MIFKQYQLINKITNAREYYTVTKKGPSSHMRDHEDKMEIRSVIQDSRD